jgi:hypothetical protein
MDSAQFDQLTRSLTALFTRRNVVALGRPLVCQCLP